MISVCSCTRMCDEKCMRTCAQLWSAMHDLGICVSKEDVLERSRLCLILATLVCITISSQMVFSAQTEKQMIYPHIV